jgi:hypothetical protein
MSIRSRMGPEIRFCDVLTKVKEPENSRWGSPTQPDKRLCTLPLGYLRHFLNMVLPLSELPVKALYSQGADEALPGRQIPQRPI